MINLSDLRERQHITTGEALLVCYRLCEKYVGVLENILRIKREVPVEDEEGAFRVKRDNTVLLEALQKILFDLEQELKVIELELMEQNHKD